MSAINARGACARTRRNGLIKRPYENCPVFRALSRAGKSGAPARRPSVKIAIHDSPRPTDRPSEWGPFYRNIRRYRCHRRDRARILPRRYWSVRHYIRIPRPSARPSGLPAPRLNRSRTPTRPSNGCSGGGNWMRLRRRLRGVPPTPDQFPACNAWMAYRGPRRQTDSSSAVYGVICFFPFSFYPFRFPLPTIDPNISLEPDRWRSDIALQLNCLLARHRNKRPVSILLYFGRGIDLQQTDAVHYVFSVQKMTRKINRPVLL